MTSKYNIDSLLDEIEDDGFGYFNNIEKKEELDDDKIELLLQSSISNMNQRKQNRKEEKDRKRRERELELERINHEAEMFRIEWEHKNNSSSSVNTIPLNKLIELMKKMEENKDPCPICFTNNEELEITLCGHIFCKKCIKEVKNNKCPMCRS